MSTALECVSKRKIRKFEWILRQFKEETRRLSSAKSRVDDDEMAQKTPKLRIREFLRRTLAFEKARAICVRTACPSNTYAAYAAGVITPKEVTVMVRKMSVFMALVLALVMALCPMGAMADEAQPVDVVDALGRTVTIDSVPEKIVSLSPSNTEILFALGVGDKVVGVDTYSDYPAEAAAIENKVGTYSNPNVELIVSLEPDVVFADDNLQQDAIDQLDKLGIKVVAVAGSDYASVQDSILMVGQCVGVDGQSVIDAMDADKAAAEALVPADGDKPSVYFALSFGEYGDWTSGTGTFVDDIITDLSATNAAADLGEGWQSISVEKLLEADPDVILVPGDESMVEAFKSDAKYAELSAVKNGAVYAVDPNMSQRPGPRLGQAMCEFAEILYPADAEVEAAA